MAREEDAIGRPGTCYGQLGHGHTAVPLGTTCPQAMPRDLSGPLDRQPRRLVHDVVVETGFINTATTRPRKEGLAAQTRTCQKHHTRPSMRLGRRDAEVGGHKVKTMTCQDAEEIIPEGCDYHFAHALESGCDDLFTTLMKSVGVGQHQHPQRQRQTVALRSGLRQLQDGKPCKTSRTF